MSIDNLKDFSKVSAKIKIFKENTSYDNLDEKIIEFDASSLVLDNSLDFMLIMEELNKVSYYIFIYGSLYDMQKRLLQNLEDEFESWKAFRLKNCGITDKECKSERSKERFLLTEFYSEYKSFKDRIDLESYNLDILRRVLNSLENYSYKLHAMKDINLSLSKAI